MGLRVEAACTSASASCTSASASDWNPSSLCTHLVLAWQGASWEGGGESRNEGLVRRWVDLSVLGLQVWTASGIERLTVRQRNAGGSGTAGASCGCPERQKEQR